MDSKRVIYLNVRKRETYKFILFSILTLGLYRYFWLYMFVKDYNKLQKNTNKISYNKCAIWYIILDVSIWIVIFMFINCFYNYIITPNPDEFIFNDKFNTLAITYKILKFAIFPVNIILSCYICDKLEEYAKIKYGVRPKHNGCGIFFLGLIYANFALNTFEERVKKEMDFINKIL